MNLLDCIIISFINKNPVSFDRTELFGHTEMPPTQWRTTQNDFHKIENVWHSTRCVWWAFNYVLSLLCHDKDETVRPRNANHKNERTGAKNGKIVAGIAVIWWKSENNWYSREHDLDIFVGFYHPLLVASRTGIPLCIETSFFLSLVCFASFVRKMYTVFVFIYQSQQSLRRNPFSWTSKFILFLKFEFFVVKKKLFALFRSCTIRMTNLQKKILFFYL